MLSIRSLLLSLALVPGCASQIQSTRPVLIPLEAKSGVVVTSAAQRQTYIRPVGKDVPAIRVCAEPMPDAVLDQRLATALEAAHKGSVSVKLRKVDLSISSDDALKYARELALDHQELAGRTWTVLLAREFLYRMCELTLNLDPGTADFAEAAKHYDKIADAITKIAEAEKEQAEGRKIEAEVERSKLKAAIDAQVAQKAELSATLLGRVTTGTGATCKVDAARLEALLKDEAYAGVRDRLRAAAGCDELRRLLLMLDAPNLAALEKVKLP